MDISLMRAEFTIFVVDRAMSESQSLVDSIRAAGYNDAQFYPTLDSAMAVARHSPPHIVLLDFDRNVDIAESFLIDLQATSPEIVVILMAAQMHGLTALQLVSRGLAYDSISRPINSTLEVIQKLDRAAERLFFQFESEQIKEHLTATGISLQSLQDAQDTFDRTTPQGHGAFDGAPAIGAAPALTNSAHGVSRINEFLTRMATTRELDLSIRFFMEGVSRELADSPVLYFKYVPSHMSLLVAQAVWLPIEKIRGLGVDLKKEDASLLTDLLHHPSKIEPMHAMISQVFKRDEFSAFPHQVDGETVGVFVALVNDSPRAEITHGDETPREIDLFRAPVLHALRQIFDLTYKRNLTLKEKHSLDIMDVTTGLINRRQLALKIDEEISRSRRIYLPLSIITIDIDHFKRLNDRIGFRQADSVLKMVAMILKKTARVSDIVARTGPDEIVLLLPHTGYQGAAVKAERVRRMIEATRFPILEGLQTEPLTISCGVSEYPSFCNDAEGLVRSADEALTQVKRAGGNKICLTMATPGFQMDFRPLDVPAASEGPRTGELS